LQLFEANGAGRKEDMTLRIERVSQGQRVVYRVSGRIGIENLDQLKAELQNKQEESALDLEHVTLVDVEGVRFLNECEEEGFELIHCSLYIREWINRERTNKREG
jgi:hypothetical protein